MEILKPSQFAFLARKPIPTFVVFLKTFPLRILSNIRITLVIIDKQRKRRIKKESHRRLEDVKMSRLLLLLNYNSDIQFNFAETFRDNSDKSELFRRSIVVSIAARYII